MDTLPLQPSFEMYYADIGSSPPSSPASPIDSSPNSSPPAVAVDPDSQDEISDIETNEKKENESKSGSIHASFAPERGTTKQKARRKQRDFDVPFAHPYAASTNTHKRSPGYAKYSKDTARPKFKRPKYAIDDFDVTMEESNVTDTRNQMTSSFARTFGFDRVNEQDRPLNTQYNIPLEQDLYPRDTKTFERKSELSDLEKQNVEREKLLWDETLAHAVDFVEGKIDLSEQSLTFIPPNIADLKNLVWVPDSNPSSPLKEKPLRPLGLRSVSKSTNSIILGANSLGEGKDEIHLFLANNLFTSLPSELFGLQALTVLSLRGNMLSEIPPQISQLQNLRELNVANNRLRYLPSEIMDMRRLTMLMVDPNPFIENPFIGSGRTDNWCSQTERKYNVLPLTELALRTLLGPDPDDPNLSNISALDKYKTLLESRWSLPLESDFQIAPVLRETMASCVPGSIASLKSALSSYQNRNYTVEYARSLCTSPRHSELVEGVYKLPVFFLHAEERFTWEKRIAGLEVGGRSGIPIKWRGCSPGCLEYLGSSEEQEDTWEHNMNVDHGGLKMIVDSSGSASESESFGFGRYNADDIDLDDV